MGGNQRAGIDPDGTGIIEAGDDNLVAAWRLLGHHARGGAVTEDDDLLLMATGQPAPFLNLAIVKQAPADPHGAAAAIVEYFDGRGLPFMVWVRDGVAPDLVEAAGAVGVRPVGNAPGMALTTIGLPPAPPEGLLIQAAGDADQLRTHVEVAAAGFGIPSHLVHDVFTADLLALDDVVFLTGHLGDDPVAASAVIMSPGGVAGIYNVATPDPHRGRGFGEAMTWAAAAAGASRGAGVAVLQSSPSGYSLYQRMGFRTYGRYLQLARPAPT